MKLQFVLAVKVSKMSPYNYHLSFVFKCVSFRGKIKLEPCPDWSPLAIYGHRRPFQMGVLLDRGVHSLRSILCSVTRISCYHEEHCTLDCADFHDVYFFLSFSFI